MHKNKSTLQPNNVYCFINYSSLSTGVTVYEYISTSLIKITQIKNKHWLVYKLTVITLWGCLSVINFIIIHTCIKIQIKKINLISMCCMLMFNLKLLSVQLHTSPYHRYWIKATNIPACPLLSKWLAMFSSS